MKKVYTKPVLMMEDFTLSQTIAHNCGDNLNFSEATLKYKESCGWNVGDVNFDGIVDVVFNTARACSIKADETYSDGFVSVCYNNPGSGYNIFNS